MDLVSKVKRNIETLRLIQPRDSVLAGVSGGADSIALLHILNALRHDLGIELRVGHINHQLHKAALAHQKFVERTCRHLNIKFFPIPINIKTRLQKEGGSVEELAREARFQSLAALARRTKSNVIALGHNQDDLAETVLMRIIRGTGPLGLQGILPKRTLKKIVIIRPLLGVKRKEIESFLKSKGLPYRVDPTNKENKFFRNKVRLHLLPYLEKNYNRQMKESLISLANISVMDYDCLSAQAETIFKKIAATAQHRVCLPLKELEKLHASIRRMLIRRAIEQLNGNTRRLTLKHIEAIEDKLSPSVQPVSLPLPQPLTARIDARNLCLIKKTRVHQPRNKKA